MKLETSKTFGNATYLLSDPEMAAMITEGGTAVSDLSPLGEIDMSRIPRNPPEDGNDLAEAIKTLSAPKRMIEVRSWPSGGDWIRYYEGGTSGNLVAHSRNSETGANMIVWPVSQNTLKSAIAAPLANGVAGVVAETGFTLKLHEFLVLASLVDCQNEGVLRGLIGRDTAPEIRFTAKATKAAYTKGLKAGDDPRWMVTRVSQGVGGPLPKTLTSVEETLTRFCEIGILVEDLDGFAPLPSVELIFRQLADVEGVSSIGVQGGNSVQRIYHANRAQIWRYELPENLDLQAEVRMKPISGAELQTDLSTLLPEFVATKGALTCPSCGVDVTADQRFCVECGAKLDIGARA